MKKFVVILSLIMAPVILRAESGSDRYTPTIMEWLVVELNAGYRSDDVPSIYYSEGGPNTIEVVIFHDKITSKAAIDNALATAKGAATFAIKRHKWNWIKVEGKTELTNQARAQLK